MNSVHCCEAMTTHLDFRCVQHSSPFECPDAIVSYSERFDEYGLIVHDGGNSSILIRFCPWCGAHLPESRREQWFQELEALGFDDPMDQDIPDRYKTGEWYRKGSGA